jgi:hypothetical protein
MYRSPTRARAAAENNRQTGLGLLCFMLMAAALLLSLPSGPEAETKADTVAATPTEHAVTRPAQP